MPLTWKNVEKQVRWVGKIEVAGQFHEPDPFQELLDDLADERAQREEFTW